MNAFKIGLLLNLITSVCYAGGGNVGGGKSVVCRDPKGSILSAELLDLYEGRVQYGKKITPSSAPVANQVSSIVQELGVGRGQSFSDTLAWYANYVNRTMQVLPNGTGLVPVNDAYNVVIPTACGVEQLANYVSDTEILITGEIFAKLDNTNQAATIVHEALYRMFRDYGATDSIRARMDVAFAFSGSTTTDIWLGLPKSYLTCGTAPDANGSYFPGARFRAYNDSTGELIFQFDDLFGAPMVSTASAVVDNISIGNLSSVPDTVYETTLASSFDAGTPISISFMTVQGPKGTSYKQMKIGVGQTPQSAVTEFVCSP